MKVIDRWLNWLNRAFWSMLPSCQETIYFISLDLDKHLSWPKRLLVRVHYQLCIYTRRYAQQLRSMQRLARSLDRDDYQLLDKPTLTVSRKADLATKIRQALNAQD